MVDTVPLPLLIIHMNLKEEESKPLSRKVNLKRIDCNEVLQQFGQDKTKGQTFYLPAYMRMHIMGIQDISVSNHKASLRAVLLFSFYYGNIDYKSTIEKMVEPKQGKGRYLVLSSSSMLSMKLDPDDPKVTVRHQEQQRMVHFEIRDTFVALLSGSYYWAPFDTSSLDLTLKVHSYTYEKGSQLKFNLMDLPYSSKNHQAKIIFPKNLSYGSFQIMPLYVFSFFTNSQRPPITFTNRYYCCFACDCCSCKCFSCSSCCQSKKEDDHHQGNESELRMIQQKVKEEKKQYDQFIDEYKTQFQTELDEKNKAFCSKIEVKLQRLPFSTTKDYDGSYKSFSVAHFDIYMFRHPTYFVMINIMAFSILNIALFFPAIRDSVSTISEILLGYVLLIPVFKAYIPQSSRRSFVEYLLYLQVFSSILTLVELIVNRRHDYSAEPFVWYRQPLYWVVAAINLFTIGSLLFLTLCYLTGWSSSYEKKGPGSIDETEYQDVERKAYLLDPYQWRNELCDYYFGQDGVQVHPKPTIPKKKKTNEPSA